MDLRKRIRQLSHKEAHVLYYTVHGRTPQEVGKLFRTEKKPQGESYAWTRKYLSAIYEKFLWKEDFSDNEKRIKLVTDAKPIIDEIVGKNPQVLKDFPLDLPDEPLEEEKTHIERIREQAEQIRESVKEQKSPKEEIPIVTPVIQEEIVTPGIQEEKPTEIPVVPPSLQPIDTFPEQEKTPPPSPDLDQKPEPVEPKLEPEKPPVAKSPIDNLPKAPRGQESKPQAEPRRNLLPFILVGLFALCVGLIGGGYLVYRFLPQNPAIIRPTPTNAVMTPTVLTQTVALTPTLPSPSPVVTTVNPTDTPLPTEIIPTNTPKAYYSPGEAVILKDGVFAVLNNSFITAGELCNKPGMDFGVKINIKNESGNQFLLRFNTSSFHAVDDIGTEYSLFASSVTNQNSPLGVDLTYQIGRGDQTNICVAFKGEIPFPATYILVTADFISGVGPVTFRKDI